MSDEPTLEAPVGLLRCVWRGARRLCPHCARGRLFKRWIAIETPCSQCGVTILEDEGDPWAFVVVFDRVFILLLVGVVYFRFGPPTTWGLAGLFGVVIGLFVYTTPHRFGGCLGLVYGVAQRRRSLGTDLNSS